MDYKYKDLFLQDSIKKELYISFDNGLITNSELHSNQFELSESICSDSELRFGGCEASELRFKVSNIYNSLKNKTIDVSMVLDGNEDEPFKFGRYTVYSDTPTADRNFRDIVAYDKMYEIVNANVADWYNSLQFPMTLKEFRTAFVSYFGINEVEIELVNDDMIVEKTIETIELSGGDVARAICEINGCFGHINRNNKFEYIVLLGNTELLPANDLYPTNELLPFGSNYSKTVSKNHYISCQYEDFITTEIDGIEVRPEEESAGAIVGNTKGNIYTIFGNFLLYGKATEQLESIANNLMPLVNNVYYRPCSIVAIGNPTIRVGDGIRLNTRHEVISTYVLQRKISGIQSLKDSYISCGTERYEHNINSSKNDVVKLKSKVNILNRNVEETVSKIEDVEKKVSTEIKQTAEGLTVEINKAKSLADDAAKYATNYLDLGSDGLIVGNMASDVLEKNVLIGSDSVSIRENDVVLSEYSEDKIELGKNSEHSVIELCGGKALMGVVEEVNQNKSFVIKALEDSLKMESSKSMNFQCLLEQYGLHLNSFITANIRNENPYILISSNKYTDDGSISELSRANFGNGKLLITTKKSDGVGVDIDVNEIPGHLGVKGNIEIQGEVTVNGTDLDLGSRPKVGSLYASTLEYFVWGVYQASSTYSYSGRVKDEGGWGPKGFACWYQFYAIMQNAPNGNYSVDVFTILQYGDETYIGCIKGTNSFYVTWQKLAKVVSNSVWDNPSSQKLYIASGNENDYRLFLGVADSNWALCPSVDGYLRCGTASFKWGQVYAKSSAISTSDRNVKKDIKPLNDRHLKFFTMLEPLSYKFVDGTSGRTHIGFISQDVEEAMTACGLSDLDFAGFCKDQKYESITLEDGTVEQKIVEGEYIYSLRYEEFIALNTYVIQKQQSEIETLKDEIVKIKRAIGLM